MQTKEQAMLDYQMDYSLREKWEGMVAQVFTKWNTEDNCGGYYAPEYPRLIGILAMQAYELSLGDTVEYIKES